MIPISKDIQNRKQKRAALVGCTLFAFMGFLVILFLFGSACKKVEINLVIVDVISMQCIIFALRSLRRQYVDNIVLHEGGIFVI